MKILGIDTSTKFLCLGIGDGTKIYEYNVELGTKMAKLLSPAIKRVLEALNWRINDIDYFACGLGPGSFTGIRVGVATIKALAWSLNKPVVGISSLDILAAGVGTDTNYIVPMLDAKRKLIYASIYKSKNENLKRMAPYMLLTEGEFLKKIKKDTLIVGDAVSLYGQEILTKIKGVVALDKDYWYPKAGNIIALAQSLIKEKKFNSPFKLKPIYLYPQECQIKQTL